MARVLSGVRDAVAVAAVSVGARMRRVITHPEPEGILFVREMWYVILAIRAPETTE